VTTIVCDGKSMGCDGQISCGETIVETNHVKVHKLPDGSIIGFAGNTFNWAPILDYFKSTSARKTWPEVEGSQDIVRLMTDGTIITYDAKGRPFERTAPVCMGSGWKYAATAMDLTNDISRSIQAAIKRDVWSSGQITILSLDA
jgi:ATP-dependent protease HslVU (ClpYQ) peptidase subunit